MTNMKVPAENREKNAARDINDITLWLQKTSQPKYENSPDVNYLLQNRFHLNGEYPR